MAPEVSSAPQESDQKSSTTVEAVGAMYNKVKGANSYLDWALTTAETGFKFIGTAAGPYVPKSVDDVTGSIRELRRTFTVFNDLPNVIAKTTKQALSPDKESNSFNFLKFDIKIYFNVDNNDTKKK